MVVRNSTVNDTVNDTVNLIQRQKEIILLIKNNRNITANEIAERLNAGIATVKRDMALLKQNNIIDREGSDKKGHWKINNND